MYEIECALAVKDKAGECPVWNAAEGILYWTDVLGKRIHRFDPNSGSHEIFTIGLNVSAIGLRAAGGLILATWEGLTFWDDTSQEVNIFANPPSEREGSRFNDAAVDRNGRFWAGAWGGMRNLDPTNRLYRLDPDGSIHTMEVGIIISNGIGWSPDNQTMYFTDSPRREIYAYDFDLASGSIENRRIFAKSHEDKGEPDGLTVDREGFIWSARWDGWKITRFDPFGVIEKEIPLPVQRPTSCTFGGSDLEDLYITTVSTGLTDEEKAKQPLAGDLLKINVGVKGIEEPSYLG